MFNNAYGGTKHGYYNPRTSVSQSPHGLSRSTIYLRISEESFPETRIMAVAQWDGSGEITEWLNQRIEASRKAAH
ncbi:MAG: AlpA family phage regulatory protein [Gammaproteobacteria bacterium]